MKSNKKIIREKPCSGEITLIKTFTPTATQKKLINFLNKMIMNSHLKKNYNFTYKTQIYSLKFILTHIIYFLHNCKNWRSLTDKWNNIYNHYNRLNKAGILEDTYTQLLKKYLKRTNNKTLKFCSCDVTIILNKNGIDMKGRSKYAKNKYCTKLFTIIDKNSIPITFFFEEGNRNDIICLNNSLKDFLIKYGSDIKYFLGDAGFYSKYILDLLSKHNIKSLIPKNIRNNKKYKKKDGTKLTYEERIKIQFEDFAEIEKQIYKKRIKVENLYANYKQINRFNIRIDKYINNMLGLTYIYFAEQIMKCLK